MATARKTGAFQGLVHQVYVGVDADAVCVCKHPARDHLVRIYSGRRKSKCLWEGCTCSAFHEQLKLVP